MGNTCCFRAQAVFPLLVYRLPKPVVTRVSPLLFFFTHTKFFLLILSTVIITSSSDAKLATARTLGADYTINYRSQPDWHSEVLRLTNNAGADVIFETGGAQTLRKSLMCVAWGGMVACIGYLSGKEEEEAGDKTNINVLALQRNATLKGILNGPRDRFEEMNAFYAAHGIKPVIDRVFSFEQGKQAFEYLASGSHFGKVVVKV